MPKPCERCRTSMSVSTKLPGSRRRSMRSRAVSLPRSCWRATACSPPPRRAASLRLSSAESRAEFASPTSGLSGCFMEAVYAGAPEPPGPPRRLVLTVRKAALAVQLAVAGSEGSHTLAASDEAPPGEAQHTGLVRHAPDALGAEPQRRRDLDD